MLSISRYFKHPRRFLLSVLKRNWFFFTDKAYLKIRYYLEMRERLNLKDPKKFTEKIQWLKLYNRKDIYTVLVDKIAVKEYVSSLIGSDIIIPTIDIWDNFEDIDFSKLPNQFVLKTNHSGGNTGVVICKDKNKFDVNRAKMIINTSLKHNNYFTTKEWPYKNVKPKIFAETFLASIDGEDLIDYKFYCFNGVPKYCQVISNRRTKETIDFFDMNWEHQEFYGLNPKCKPSTVAIGRPENFDVMNEIAMKLSQNIPFVRVDMYNVKGKIYFGEITFFPASGYGVFTPKKWDEILGSMIVIKNYDNK